MAVGCLHDGPIVEGLLHRSTKSAGQFRNSRALSQHSLAARICQRPAAPMSCSLAKPLAGFDEHGSHMRV
jgi:hypothetical protein